MLYGDVRLLTDEVNTVDFGDNPFDFHVRAFHGDYEYEELVDLWEQKAAASGNPNAGDDMFLALSTRSRLYRLLTMFGWSVANMAVPVLHVVQQGDDFLVFPSCFGSVKFALFGFRDGHSVSGARSVVWADDFEEFVRGERVSLVDGSHVTSGWRVPEVGYVLVRAAACRLGWTVSDDEADFLAELGSDVRLWWVGGVDCEGACRRLGVDVSPRVDRLASLLDRWGRVVVVNGVVFGVVGGVSDGLGLVL